MTTYVCAYLLDPLSRNGPWTLEELRAAAFLLWAMRQHAVGKALDEVLAEVQDRVDAVGSDGASRAKKSGTIISVAGASGGVGTTSVGVNLACALAQGPERSVVLVDLDLSLGDADVFLDMIPDYTLLDVAQNISRLDLALLRKSLTKWIRQFPSVINCDKIAW